MVVVCWLPCTAMAWREDHFYSGSITLESM
jgi:hypothetical protein